MSQKVQILRSLVEQRLTAAAEEIFGLFERTIAEYEEELCRTKEENQRQKQIVETGLLHTSVSSTDTHQQFLVKEEVPPEQKEWSPSVDQNQEDPEDPHIKEEQEEIWTNQEADITMLPSTCVPVRSEAEEKALSSQLHQRQTEKNQEETEVEDCDGLEPASSLDPYRHLRPVSDNNSLDSSETEDSDSDSDWTETHRTQSRSKCGKTITLAKADDAWSNKERPFPCSFCDKRFTLKRNLSRHMRYHTGERPFSCSICTKSFIIKDLLNRHLRVHTGEKPFSCNICLKCYTTRGHLTRHMLIHTGKRPFSCSVCGKTFIESRHLNRHMKVHTTDSRVHFRPKLDDGSMHIPTTS